MQPGSFGDLMAPEDLELVRARGGRRRFPRGTILFHEGETPDRVLLLERGRVKVSTVSRDGHETVLAVRGPGDLLGELSAVDGDAPSATVVALEEVEAHAMSTEDFRRVLSDSPRIALLLLGTLSNRLRDADRKRMEFGAYDTEGRVASRLVELAERFGPAEPTVVHLDLPISQEELAGWVGSSREAVSKALRALREDGCIETGRKTVTILDLSALRARAT
ncbi:MAG TPA: Crp/Fnr family transcriptional regulator [Actinomycetota bacterium]|nr:Crp/Fnr family transcriptional regulator [Actinomycetota bacterium]